MSAKAKQTPLHTVPIWKKYMPYFIGLIAFLAFANTLGNDYNMDDELVTRKHKYTSKGLSAVKDIFTKPYYSDAMGYAYGYRPMVHLSYAMEHQFFGESPAMSHFINVLLYAVLVMVFFRLLYLWAGEKGLIFSVVAALLFALHPVHTEVVASLKNRDEILALLFGLLAGLSASRAALNNKLLPMFMAGFWFLLALLSKKSMFPLVFVFPLALLLFTQISLKQLLILCAIWVIPGAWIVADKPDMKMALLFVLPFIFNVGIWWVKNKFVTHEQDWRLWLKTAWFSPVALILLSIFGLWKAYHDFSLFYLGISALAGATVVLFKRTFGAITLIAWLAMAGFLFGNRDLSVTAVLLGAFFSFAQLKELKANKIRVLAFIVPTALFLFRDPHPGNIFLILAIGGVFFLMNWKMVLGLGFILIFIVLSSIFSESIDSLQLGLLIIGLFSFLQHKYASVQLVRFGILALFLGGCVFFVFKEQRLFMSQTTTQVLETPALAKQIRNSALQEGRVLEFAENTLMAPHSKSETFGTGAYTLLEYFRLMVFPYELSFYYGYAYLDTEDLTNPWVWLSLLIHLGLFVLALFSLKKRPLLSMGIFWYLISILLFSNWVELVAGMVGERLAFTASAGFCMTLAAILVWIKPELNFRKPALPELFLGLILLAFGFRTLLRNSDWKDAVTLMGHDIKHLDNSAQANNLYALNLMSASYDAENYSPVQQQNMRKLAIIHFDKALQIWPNFYNAAYDKGRASLTIGDYISAIDGFEKAVAMDNDFMDPYYQLSELYINTKRYPEFLMNARRLFSKEIERPEKYNLMARGFYLNGMSDSAKIYLHLGMERHPGDLNLPRNLAEIYKSEGKADSASYYSR